MCECPGVTGDGRLLTNYVFNLDGRIHLLEILFGVIEHFGCDDFSIVKIIVRTGIALDFFGDVFRWGVRRIVHWN
jgi:hypothetical protein